MIDIDALKAAGFSNEALKKVFTAEEPRKPAKAKSPTPPKDDRSLSDIETFNKSDKDAWTTRQFLERQILSILNESMDRNASLFSLYGAVDLAYESTPINKLRLPFDKVAQGLINLDQCRDQIAELSPTMAEQLFKKKGDTTFKVNIPRLFEISHNLVHSLVTRRVASVATPVAQRFPFLKYESRSTTQIGRLRADLMTQRAEIMSDQYGYRNDAIQTVRAVSLYGHQVEFKRSAWDHEKQVLAKRTKPNGASKTGKTPKQFAEVIVREGVEFIAPHPSRVFWDVDEPLSKLNADIGPSYIGYWDLVRLGTIRGNSLYYNKDKLAYDTKVYDYIAQNKAYFSQYYRDRISIPQGMSGNVAAVSLNNDRKYKIEFYAQASDRTTTTLAQLFMKVVPKDLGIGTYANPVWIRLVVSGNCTVIFAEVVGSAPACYYNYNESDDREVSPTFAQQVMPYQDQTTNLLTQLLEIQQQGLTRIFSIATDGMTKEQVDQLERSLTNRDYYAAKDIIIKFSVAKIRDRGEDPRIFMEKVRMTEIASKDKVTEIFQSIIQLLAIAERLLFFSPQELGQVAPREVTATEANMVNSTTLGIRDFHGLGIDMGLDAKKRIIYESTVTFGSDQVTLPAAERYDDDVVKQAGWTIEDEGLGGQAVDKTFTLSGAREGLVHDYVFTSRDGFDRPLPSAEAQALVTALDVASRDQTLSQVMTWRQKLDLYNDLIRKISGVQLKLQVPKGVNPDDPIAGGRQIEQAIQQLAAGMQQISATQQQQQKDMQSLAQSLTALAGTIKDVSLTVQQVATKQGQVEPGTAPGAGAPALKTARPLEVNLAPETGKEKRTVKTKQSADGSVEHTVTHEAPARV